MVGPVIQVSLSKAWYQVHVEIMSRGWEDGTMDKSLVQMWGLELDIWNPCKIESGMQLLIIAETGNQDWLPS